MRSTRILLRSGVAVLLAAISAVAAAAPSKCGLQPNLPCITSWTCLKTGWAPSAYSAAGATCDDANPCTRSETCDGAGSCVGTSDPPVTVFAHDPAGNLTSVANTTSDLQNCGCLGHVCAGAQNGTVSCTDGACVTTCNAGYTRSWGGCVPTSIPAGSVELVFTQATFIDEAVAHEEIFGLMDWTPGLYLTLTSGNIYPCPLVYGMKVNSIAREYSYRFQLCETYDPDWSRTWIDVFMASADDIATVEGSSSLGYLTALDASTQPTITGAEHGNGPYDVIVTGDNLDHASANFEILVDYFVRSRYGSWWEERTTLVDSIPVILSPRAIAFHVTDPVLDGTPYQIVLRWSPEYSAGGWSYGKDAYFRGVFGGTIPPAPPPPPPPWEPIIIWDPISLEPLYPSCTNSTCN